MVIKLTRYDGGLKIQPCPPAVSSYLHYWHKAPQKVKFRMEMRSVKTALHTMDDSGAAYTFPGFFKRVTTLLTKEMLNFQVEDLRTPLPEPDWGAVKRIRLREYQYAPVAALLTEGLRENGLIEATGGFGELSTCHATR